jgi:predicted DNA-binding transcriptional regulator AlpA
MVRDVLSQFRNRMISADEVAERLGLSRSGLYKLYTKYLAASAGGGADTFVPGVSGGDRAAPWPKEVADGLRRWLSATPPYSFAFAASEAHRLFGFRLFTKGQVI